MENVDVHGDDWCVIVEVGTDPVDTCPQVYVNDLTLDPAALCLA